MNNKHLKRMGSQKKRQNIFKSADISLLGDWLMFVAGFFGNFSWTSPGLMTRKHIAKVVFLSLSWSFFLMNFSEVRISLANEMDRGKRR